LSSQSYNELALGVYQSFHETLVQVRATPGTHAASPSSFSSYLTLSLIGFGSRRNLRILGTTDVVLLSDDLPVRLDRVKTTKSKEEDVNLSLFLHCARVHDGCAHASVRCQGRTGSFIATRLRGRHICAERMTAACQGAATQFLLLRTYINQRLSTIQRLFIDQHALPPSRRLGCCRNSEPVGPSSSNALCIDTTVPVSAK
jgi:hypothetical protein